MFGFPELITTFAIGLPRGRDDEADLIPASGPASIFLQIRVIFFYYAITLRNRLFTLLPETIGKLFENRKANV